MVKIGSLFGSGSGNPEGDAARLLKDGNYLEAGRRYEEAGRDLQAVEAYLEGREYRAAADVLARTGKHAKAAELYLKARDPRKAGEALVKSGDPSKAADLFLQQGNSLEAARLYGVAGAWDKAGDLYAKGGYPLRAAQAYEKTGDLRKAATCYEQHFVENVSYGTTPSPGSSADQKAALLAGQLFEKAGELSRALEIFGRGGYFKEAAVVASSLGEFAKAAELYTRSEHLESAAEAWDKAGDPVKAALLRGEVAFKADRMAEAADFFLQGQDYYRAAELFESIGLLEEAAGAYQTGGSFGEAGSAYLRAGRQDLAAAAYEMGGQFETAAKLYEEFGDGPKAALLFEKAGLTFKSGEAAARAGDKERAIALLQRVPPDDESFSEATELLAQLFLEVGMPQLAVERLQLALQGQPVTRENVNVYYWLAACHEALNDDDAALAIYQKILAIDFSFRDVTERVRQIQSGGAPAAATSEPAAAPAGPSEAAGPQAPMAMPPGPLGKGPRFVIDEEVGRGPLGSVSRATDQTDGRSVALRVLPPQALKPELLGPLVGELVAAARLSHPNLVKVLGVVDFDGRNCVLSEFVRGVNMGESLRAGQRMSVQQCHSLGRALSQVLSFIHARGMVHGSLQPSNIMVVSDIVKLADLGLGRLFRSVTPPDCYRAPENRLDVAGDIYALGAVLYHLLTGVEPKVRTQGAPMHRPSQLAPGVPERFDNLLLRCLDPRPDARFSAADEVLKSLEAMITIS